MTWLRITRDRKLFVGPCRIHHGVVGLALLIHDIRDWRCWLRDLIGGP